MLALPNATVTVATGAGAAAVTVSEALPVIPSLAATMLALPAATDVTCPLALTVATPVLELDQVIERPVSVLPPASFKMAVACVFCPAVNEDEASDTETVATGTAFTVSDAVPETPSLVA